jgi:hypothetical protein
MMEGMKGRATGAATPGRWKVRIELEDRFM